MGPRMTSIQRQWYLFILATWKQAHYQTSKVTRRNWFFKGPHGCGWLWYYTAGLAVLTLCISHLPFPSLDLGFHSSLPTSLTQKGVSLSILLGERSSGSTPSPQILGVGLNKLHPLVVNSTYHCHPRFGAVQQAVCPMALSLGDT